MLKQLLRVLRFVTIAFAVVGIGVWTWLRTTDATASDFSSLRRGDVVFQTSGSSQSLAILLASSSPFSHMGIVDFDTDNKLVVLEAIATTQATPLEDWVKRGVGQRVAVYRAEGLDDGAANAVAQVARQHFGKAYDPFFFNSEDQLYCSELVHIAFRDGAGRKLGTYQPVGNLNLDNIAARQVIERRWQRYPLCVGGQVENFESCLSIIRRQTLITPQSIAEDEAMKLVFSNYGAIDP